MRMLLSAVLFALVLSLPLAAAPPQEATAPSVGLRGQVTDAAGRPLADAVVRVSPMPEWDSFSRSQGSAKTGTDGRFVVEGLAEGEPVWVKVCRAGYLPLEEEAVPLAEPLQFQMQPGARISGRVRDPKGRPIAGAAVRAVEAGREHVSSTWTGNLSAGLRSENCGGSGEWVTTRKDGSFTLESLPRGLWSVEAMAQGYVSAVQKRLPVIRPPGLDKLEIVLSPVAVLTGVVLAPDGSPVAGAQVREGSLPSVETGKDGTYRFVGLAPGESWVSAWHKDYETGRLKAEIPPGESRLDLRLGDPCTRISGRVVSPDGKPVAGATIRVPGLTLPGGVSLADGSFTTLPCRLPVSTVQLLAWADGYTQGETEPLQIGEASIEGIEIRLGPPPSKTVVTGRILGLRPEELSKLRLRLQVPGKATLPVQIDASGRYRTAPLLPTSYEIEAAVGLRRFRCELSLEETPEVRAESWCLPQHRAAEDAPPSRPAVLEDGSAAVELDLTLPSGFEVSGRVLGSDGKPLEGVSLGFSPCGRGYVTSVWSRADGSFEANLESGRYRVSSSRQGHVRPGLSLTVDGAAISGLEIRWPPRALLRGRVRGQEAWERVSIHATSSEGWATYGEVDADGEFRLDASPGVWDVTAVLSNPDRRATGRVVVPRGAAEAKLDLQLQPADPPEYKPMGLPCEVPPAEPDWLEELEDSSSPPAPL